ncbi:MAG TPA: transporter [Noviherbaspirillum sp.]|uniref:transporter n=1 Tax=Noviherbaspirillum sp. TaxID=1926288 RepID=UPI002D4DC944|nr:transporter [Noviherbaspirillum sp.]HYD95282.1 transporter [Noviherbaspirillum sp.]
MKKMWMGGAALLAALPALGQSVEELKRQLAEKEAETRRLRERIQILEREVTPHRIKQAKGAQAMPEDAREDSNRALERALVRENGVLLPPGRFEIEPNLVYSHSTAAANAFRRDAYGPALVVRAGLPGRSQIDLSLPYVFERRRSAGLTTDASGIGDVTLGVSHQFMAERASLPGLIGSLAYTASTGKNTVFESAAPVALGSGFRTLQASLTAIKRVDPLVFFGSYSFSHAYAADYDGLKVDPGNSHGLRFGTALATGPNTSLRAAFNVTYYDSTKVGGVPLEASEDPSALLELGGSVVLSERTALDVLVGAGLTGNAPDYRITVALPVRF